MARTFRYRVDSRYLPVLLLFGFRPSRDGVELGDDGNVTARFGWLRLVTDRSNIDGAHITGAYRWWTAVGARRSFADDGLTFGTNNRAGVCIHFRDRVSSPLGPRGHSALTVTVDDLEGLVQALGEN